MEARSVESAEQHPCRSTEEEREREKRRLNETEKRAGITEDASE